MQSGKKAQKPGGRREADSAAGTVEDPTYSDGKALNWSLSGYLARNETVIGLSTS